MNELDREAFEKLNSPPEGIYYKDGKYVSTDEAARRSTFFIIEYNGMWLGYQQGLAQAPVVPEEVQNVMDAYVNPKRVTITNDNGKTTVDVYGPNSGFSLKDVKHMQYVGFNWRDVLVPEGQFMLPREFLVEYLELLRDSDKSAIYKLVTTDQVGVMLKESK